MMEGPQPQQKKKEAPPNLIEEWRMEAKEEEKQNAPLLSSTEQDEEGTSSTKPTPEERRRAFAETPRELGFCGSVASLLSSLPSFASSAPISTRRRSRPCLRWGFSFSRWPLRFLRLHDQPLRKQEDNATENLSQAVEEEIEEEEEDERIGEYVAHEETKGRAVMLINLLVALIFVNALVLSLRLWIDGWNHLSSWQSLFSMSVYGCLLWLARLFNDHGRTSAWVSCLYFNLILIYKCVLYGVRTEMFSWIAMMPLVLFCLVGPRAGVVATFGLIGESLLIYALTPDDAHNGQAFDLACVQLNQEQGIVFVPFACAKLDIHGAHIGRFPTSLQELLTSKILLIAFMGVFAYVYESNRRSALRRMMVALQQKERVNVSLQQATKAKTAFLANMSHELRTPMHGIIAMAKDLMEMPLSEGAFESARIISDCADHLLGLVNDILDFARIESNQLELESIPLSVCEEVDKAVSLHTVMAKKKHVALISEIDIAQPLRLGDPLRFRQILHNLLSNAIKFTPAEGHVMVSASTGQADPEIVSVSVADTGIGIPPQGLENIFKSFSQLDASVGRKFGGSGLGLAISKKLSLAMQGDIKVESEVGKGSVFTFTVRLPLYQPKTPLTMRRAHPTTEDGTTAAVVKDLLHGRKVLVVEDNIINQKVATKMLTSLGCSVTIAGDGGAAVGLFERETFDVILMDVQMPIMDGFQATARIRHIEHRRAQTWEEYRCEEKPKSKELKPEEGDDENENEKEAEVRSTTDETEVKRTTHGTKRVPIVALTASATRDYETECLEKGMDRFLTKPFRKETLQATLIGLFRPPPPSEISSPPSPAPASPPSSPH
jgi:signal transduction histidine kinase/AmiR/NasT family two-component response regulator